MERDIEEIKHSLENSSRYRSGSLEEETIVKYYHLFKKNSNKIINKNEIESMLKYAIVNDEINKCMEKIIVVNTSIIPKKTK
jgi:Ca2+-binding EF-hand superfamily protein